jgi:hypothetical protein
MSPSGDGSHNCIEYVDDYGHENVNDYVDEDVYVDEDEDVYEIESAWAP